MMLRLLLVGVIAVGLVAVMGCGDDGDGSPSASVTVSSSASAAVATTPVDEAQAAVEYSLKIIDWADRLRNASLVIADAVAQYGSDITLLGDLTLRQGVFDAFETIGGVAAEYGSAAAPASLAAVHQRMGESLGIFGEARGSVTLAYAAWDSGQSEATSLQLSDTADSMNNANLALNEVIASVTEID